MVGHDWAWLGLGLWVTVVSWLRGGVRVTRQRWKWMLYEFQVEWPWGTFWVVAHCSTAAVFFVFWCGLFESPAPGMGRGINVPAQDKPCKLTQTRKASKDHLQGQTEDRKDPGIANIAPPKHKAPLGVAMGRLKLTSTMAHTATCAHRPYFTDTGGTHGHRQGIHHLQSNHQRSPLRRPSLGAGGGGRAGHYTAVVTT